MTSLLEMRIFLDLKQDFLDMDWFLPYRLKDKTKQKGGRVEELDMDVGKTDSEKMVHKFRTLESDLDGHTYHKRMPLQNL